MNSSCGVLCRDARRLVLLVVALGWLLAAVPLMIKLCWA